MSIYSTDKLIQVKLRYIPAIYPNESYVGLYYHYSAYAQKLVEPFENLVITSKKHKTIHNINESRNVLIQTQYYEQFEIVIKATETTANEIVLIAQAQKLQIVDEYNNVFEAEFIEKQYEDVAQTKLKKITIRYKARSNDSTSISSHVESDVLIDQYSASELIKLTTGSLANGNDYFYTKFYPTQRSEMVKRDIIDLYNGKKYPLYECFHTYYDCKFYLSDANLKLFVERMAEVQTFEALHSLTLDILGGGTINRVSLVEYEVVENDELVNLNEVNFKFITAITEWQY